MDNFEKVEKLVNKAGVTYEEAKAALEQAGGDLLDAMIILEKGGKTVPPEQSTYSTQYEEQAQYVSVATQVENDRKNYDKEEQRRERREKFRNGLQRLWDFLSKNFLVIKKNSELVARLPLWSVVIIFLLAWHISLIALVVSLFFGVTYSFKGEADLSAANNVMGKASSAAEKAKEEFNKM